jgi:hypothetical protein
MKKFWNLLNVAATGIIVLVMFSLLLFLGRLVCYKILWQLMPQQYKDIAISPSGIVPGEEMPVRQIYVRPNEKAGVLIDSNIRLSSVQANIEDSVFGDKSMGIFNIFMKAIMQHHYRNEKGIFYRFTDENNFLLFNERTGLFNRKAETSAKTPEGEKIAEVSELFAGPNGISEKESSSLGRFEDPIVCEFWGSRKLQLYDRNKRRFFIADFNEGKVVEGLELAKGDVREPIAMGWIEKGSYRDIKLEWHVPEVKDVNGNWTAQELFFGNDEPNWGMTYRPFWDPSQRYITVLARGGRIYNLDTIKWTLMESGFLPIPASLFSGLQPKGIALPEDLLAYQIIPIYSYLRVPEKDKKSWNAKDVRYLGMFVAALSREGTALAVNIFDSNGRLICRADTKGTFAGWTNTISSALAIYGSPWNSFWTPVEYIFENLQPPVLEAASYLCANCFEASAGHRAIFILPNSFVGMLGRALEGTFLERQVIFFLQIGLSLILAVWLALRVRKDAILVGLSRTEKKWWIAGTIAFGLPAYITYRLTRPKETLVSCPNCGKMRRPDMETCHRCGSKWEVPELTPPSWRICD